MHSLDAEIVTAVSIVILGIGIYFLPALVALIRKHYNKFAIFVLNLLLGWSFIGWVGALVWACTNPKKSE